MRALRHNSAFCARAFVALALLAMLVRALIPQGYMLSAPQDGQLVSIQICSGVETTHALLDLKTGAIIEHGGGNKPAPETQKKTDAPCVFAAIAHLAEPPTPVLLGGLIAAVQPTAFALFAVAPGLGLAAPPPWSTGPPALD